MRYFSLHNGDHKLVGIGTGIGGNEITEAEYNALLAEIREKAAFVDKLCMAGQNWTLQNN